MAISSGSVSKTKRIRSNEAIGLMIRNGNLVIRFRPLNRLSVLDLEGGWLKTWQFEHGVSARLSGGNHYHELEIPLALTETLLMESALSDEPAILKRIS